MTPRHWGPFRAGFHPPAPVTAPASRLVASSVLPAQLSSLPGPGHGPRQAGGLQPCSPSSLFSPSPVPATHHLCLQRTGEQSSLHCCSREPPPDSSPLWTPFAPCPPPECNPSLPVTFFPAFLPLQEGLARSPGGFICSFAFCGPCYHQCTRLWV